MRDLTGRLALVTGGGSGIGEAMARAFASAGMSVIVADIDLEAASESAEALSRQGKEATALQLDVTDRKAWADASRRIRMSQGPVAVICNNAGISYSRFPLSELSPLAWDRILQVNVTGVFNGSQAFVNELCDAALGGHIVNTASILGFLSAPDLGAYITSKFAVLGLSEVLRHELAPRGIGVSILCPGFVATRIALNSMKYADASQDPVAFAAERSVAAEKFQSAMDPDSVGTRVLEAVRRNEFHVFTHPEYRDLLAGRFDTILDSFGPGAQPGYADDVSVLGSRWLRASPEEPTG